MPWTHSPQTSSWFFSGVLAIVVSACVGQVAYDTPTRAPATVSEEAVADAPRSFQRLRRTEIRSIVATFAPESVSGAFLTQVLAVDSLSLRLAKRTGEHDAVGLVFRHCRRLEGEGVPAARFALAEADAARESYAFTLTKLGLATSRNARSRLGTELRGHAARLELHAWRLVGQIYETLSASDRARLGRFSDLQRIVITDPKLLLASLAPPAPGYHVLLSALKAYESRLSERGEVFEPGWLSLSPGDDGPLVLSLRYRLKLEDIPVIPTGSEGRWGEGLSAGLRLYQKRYSLAETGRVDDGTLAALRVPLKERAVQIRSVLRHMEAVPYYREPTRIIVNVPAFTLQHFEGGRVVSRHRVVVGAIARDKSGLIKREGRINATPLLSGKINSIVLNPSWHVPPRIKQELDALALRNPAIFDTFRLYTDDEGRERAVQPPSPYSALGKVKLGFPNSQAIFLHDTPRTELFREKNRAFSHGCVRVENAVSLAKSLLDRDPNTLGATKASGLLRTNFETPIRLTHGVPVYIEYVTVGVGPDGGLRFFPDVYGLGHVEAAKPDNP